MQSLNPYHWSVPFSNHQTAEPNSLSLECPFYSNPKLCTQLKTISLKCVFIQSKITRLKSLSLECPFYPIIKLQNLISTCCCSAANSTESQPGTILPIADFYYCKIQLIWNLATAGINYGTHHHVLSFNLPSSIPVPVSYLLYLNDGNAPIKNITHNVNRIWLQMGEDISSYGHIFNRTFLILDISYTQGWASVLFKRTFRSLCLFRSL